VTINEIEIFFKLLLNKLGGDDNSHIIFGSGNFPKNGFNLNYISLILVEVEVEKDGVVISRHNFNKFIHNKSFDLTNNCNFINKI
jgi:hypothetical protein